MLKRALLYLYFFVSAVLTGFVMAAHFIKPAVTLEPYLIIAAMVVWLPCVMSLYWLEGSNYILKTKIATTPIHTQFRDHKKPIIVMAACRNKRSGKIIFGIRHCDSLMRKQVKVAIYQKDWDFGFLDQYGTYHNRQEAWKIAVSQGQISRRVKGDEANGGTLYSENYC